MERDLLPWEKQSGESAKAFHAFTLYRDMRAGRSLANVGRTLGETGVAGPSMVAEWSARWRWVERADAYDRDQDRRDREEHDRARADARRTQTMAGTLLIGGAIRRIAGDDGESDIAPLNLNEMSPTEVARWAEVGAKLQDRGLGIVPDLHGATSVSGRAVYDLTRQLLVLAVEAVEEGMRAAAGANGNIDALIELHQENLFENAGTLYRRTTR
jgi:hypothetical protein